MGAIGTTPHSPQTPTVFRSNGGFLYHPGMPLEFDRLRPRIAELCRRYRVRRLEAFGSALRADFDGNASDVDLMVEFAEADPQGAADRYFGLHEALESMLGRPVDLVVRGAVRNPYFLDAVDRNRLSLYAS